MDENYLIIGEGISGRGAAAALGMIGKKCTLFDDASGKPLPSGNFTAVIVSPGVKENHAVFDYAAQKGIPIFGEIELGYRIGGSKVIAVTGTNGKTTVVRLITDMLNASGISAVACGNIGLPYSLAAARGGHEWAVVEVSSFQLMHTLDFRPDIAVITNIASDHIDRHGSIENYINAKLRIALRQTDKDKLILSQEGIPLFALKGFAPSAQVAYTSVRGKVRGAYMLDGGLYLYDKKICDRDMVRLPGDFNVANALSALLAAKFAGADISAAVRACGAYEPEPYRFVLTGVKRGKNFYNDSKATNIAAAVAAAKALEGDTVLIAGGSDKGEDFARLFAELPKNIVRVIATGDTARSIERAAFSCGYYAVEVTDSLSEAVRLSVDGNEVNVLFSPACASFDRFSSYTERGKAFDSLIRGL